MQREDPTEIELRQDLRELHRKATALKEVFPASNKAEKIIERTDQEWTQRLDVERRAELRQVTSDPTRTNDKFNQLQAGLTKAIKEIGQGREPDLAFTIRQPSIRPDLER